MQVNIENLKALATGHDLNIYQKGDALNELNKLIEHTEKLEKISIIDGVSTRFGVFSKVDDVFTQLSVCTYDKKEDAESFADSMLDTIKFHDTEIVILNVC